MRVERECVPRQAVSRPSRQKIPNKTNVSHVKGEAFALAVLCPMTNPYESFSLSLSLSKPPRACSRSCSSLFQEQRGRNLPDVPLAPNCAHYVRGQDRKKQRGVQKTSRRIVRVTDCCCSRRCSLSLLFLSCNLGSCLNREAATMTALSDSV